ncbi:MAG: YmdB family metallophosphoesterase [Treponema sp.]|nr:YmdB family metallophosphoesterase [Treponema sp.]
MRVLYVAELVGKAGIYSLKKALAELKSSHPWDFLIVCGDGATGGNGLGRSHAAYIQKLGADTITLGECCFYKKDLTENIEKMPFILRPENLNHGSPGIGSKVFRAGDKRIAVTVLMGQNGFSRINANSPFTALAPILEKLRKQTPYIIVDFHAQATAEKMTLFYAADSHCSAVIGSHTRVQTADEKISAGGTAFISDAGRTGSMESVGGCDVNSRIQEYLTGIPDWTKDAWDSPQLQGVYLKLAQGGKATSIERVRVAVQAP